MADLTQILGGSFDSSQVAPADDYTPIPDGQYLAVITDSEVKQTKAMTGYYLQLTWEIIDGQYKGRKIWDRLNINNPNKTAEEIGQRALSSICAAVGVIKVNDTYDLHGKPVQIKVVVRAGNDGYDPSNEIKAYSAASAQQAAPAPVQQPVQQQPAQPAPVQQAAPAQAAAPAGSPPWARK